MLNRPVENKTNAALPPQSDDISEDVSEFKLITVTDTDHVEIWDIETGKRISELPN